MRVYAVRVDVGDKEGVPREVFASSLYAAIRWGVGLKADEPDEAREQITVLARRYSPENERAALKKRAAAKTIALLGASR